MQIRIISFTLFLLGQCVASIAADADISLEEQPYLGSPYISLNGVLDSAIRNPRPMYPPKARRYGICGDVTVAVKVGSDGKVAEARILSSTPPSIFDSAVMEVANRWVFKKVLINGEPVIYQTKVPFKFRLTEPECHPNAAIQALGNGFP